MKNTAEKEIAEQSVPQAKKTTKKVIKKPTETLENDKKPVKNEQKRLKTNRIRPKTTNSDDSVPQDKKVSSEKKKEAKRQIKFYKIDTDRDGIFKGFTIKLVELLEFIKSLGFYRYDLENGVSLFVHVNEKIVRIVQQQEITDTLIKEIENSKGCNEVSTRMIIEKIYGNFGRYTGTKFYERLTTEKPFEFVEDTTDGLGFAKKHNVKTVIEVGCWLGASTRSIARLIPEDGKVYAIDHWKGSAEHQTVHAHKLPTLYEQFLSNVIHEKLTHKIVPIRKSSLEAAQECKVMPDLIYLDASHDEKSVYEDLVAWWPFVKGRGILCGDDYWRSGDPVGKAVRRFAKENGLRVEGYRWFWVLWEK